MKNTRTGRRALSPAFFLLISLIIILAVFVAAAVVPSGISSMNGKGTAAGSTAAADENSGVKEMNPGHQEQVPQEDSSLQGNAAEDSQKTDSSSETEAPSSEAAETDISGETAAPPAASSGDSSALPPSPSAPKTPEAPEQTDGRYAYLTFDDGPSRNTEKILRILAENDIRATFFVIGRTDETSMQRYRMIAEAGHTLAMHSYTHNYGEIYASMDAFRADFQKISDLLTQITGSRPLLYRFPGGSSNTLSSRKVPMTEMIQFLNDQNVQYFDWNVNSADASGRNPDAGLLVQNVKNGLKYHHNIILMHDAAGHETTVDALPGIIQTCRDRGLTFRTIDKDTPPSHHHRRD